MLHDRRIFALISVVIVLAAGLVRFYASLGDFWLDEIWTWMIATRLQSAGQILTGVHQENNHYLNTWIVWQLGPERHWIVYRLPAVLAGTATVALAGVITRHDRLASILAMLLVAVSYPLVHYSSEARGYAYVVLFAAAAYWQLRRAIERPSGRAEWLFAAACVLGFLSQPMFVYFYAAAGLWSVWAWTRSGRRRGDIAISLLRAHLLPTAFAAWLYVVDLRQTVNAGGTIYRLREVVIETISLAVGGPAAGLGAWLTAAVVCVGLSIGLWWTWRPRTTSATVSEPIAAGPFYLLVIVVAPAVLLLVLQRNEVYLRYFLISMFFLLLVLSRLLAGLFRRGRLGVFTTIALLFAIVLGNARHLQRLMEFGRGQYVTALLMMNARSESDELIVGSDHDFRNGMLLAFYDYHFPELKPVRYLPQQQWTASSPEWVLLHSQEPDYTPPPEFTATTSTVYDLVATFPYAGLSGWHWAVYHRR